MRVMDSNTSPRYIDPETFYGTGEHALSLVTATLEHVSLNATESGPVSHLLRYALLWQPVHDIEADCLDS